MRWAAISIGLWASSPGAAPPRYLQGTCGSSAAPLESATVSLPGPVGQGDYLVLFVDLADPGNRTMTVADSLGQRWDRLTALATGPNGRIGVESFGTFSDGGLLDLTVTLTRPLSPGTDFLVFVHAYSGVGSIGPTFVDAGLSATPGTIVTSTVPESVCVMIAGYGDRLMFAPPGFTLRQQCLGDLSVDGVLTSPRQAVVFPAPVSVDWVVSSVLLVPPLDAGARDGGGDGGRSDSGTSDASVDDSGTGGVDASIDDAGVPESRDGGASLAQRYRVGCSTGDSGELLAVTLAAILLSRRRGRCPSPFVAALRQFH